MSNDELKTQVNKSLSEMMLAHSEGNMVGLIGIYIDKNGYVRSSTAFNDFQMPALFMGIELNKNALLQAALHLVKPIERNKQ